MAFWCTTRCSNIVQVPLFCTMLETKPVFKLSCPLPVIFDVQQTSTVEFKPNNLLLEIHGVELTAGFPLLMITSNIAGIIQLILSIKLFTGATIDDGYTQDI